MQACCYRQMHIRAHISLWKAEVCSGMERFNILKPNYTCPCIALYAYIESTESAYESSHFSWVNKKLHSQYIIYLKHPFLSMWHCYTIMFLFRKKYQIYHIVYHISLSVLYISFKNSKKRKSCFPLKHIICHL